MDEKATLLSKWMKKCNPSLKMDEKTGNPSLKMDAKKHVTLLSKWMKKGCNPSLKTFLNWAAQNLRVGGKVGWGSNKIPESICGRLSHSSAHQRRKRSSAASNKANEQTKKSFLPWNSLSKQMFSSTCTPAVVATTMNNQLSCNCWRMQQHFVLVLVLSFLVFATVFGPCFGGGGDDDEVVVDGILSVVQQSGGGGSLPEGSLEVGSTSVVGTSRSWSSRNDNGEEEEDHIVEVPRRWWNKLGVMGNVVGDAECEELYGLMPCSTSLGGNLSLLLIYGFMLLKAAQLLSDGSELLLAVLSPGIIGGLVLPILGALPDALLILGEQQLLILLKTIAAASSSSSSSSSGLFISFAFAAHLIFANVVCLLENPNLFRICSRIIPNGMNKELV